MTRRIRIRVGTTTRNNRNNKNEDNKKKNTVTKTNVLCLSVCLSNILILLPSISMFACMYRSIDLHIPLSIQPSYHRLIIHWLCGLLASQLIKFVLALFPSFPSHPHLCSHVSNYLSSNLYVDPSYHRLVIHWLCGFLASQLIKFVLELLELLHSLVVVFSSFHQARNLSADTTTTAI